MNGLTEVSEMVRLAAPADACRNGDKSSVDYIGELMVPIKVPSARRELAAWCRSIRPRRYRDQVGKPISAVHEKEPDGRKRGKKKTGDPAQWKGRVPRPKKSV
jgi:hypothetical protein